MPTTYRILHASDLHLSEVPYMVRNLQVAEGREKHPDWWQQAKNALLTGHDEDVLEAFAQFVYLYGPNGLALSHSDLASPPIYGYWGQGRAYANLIQDLVTETTRAIEKYRSSTAEPAVVWAIHFDAMTQSGALALLDSHNLLNAAKRQHIPILLCGHTHCSRAQPVLSSTVAFVCGTTTQGASTNPVNGLTERVATGAVRDVTRCSVRCGEHP